MRARANPADEWAWLEPALTKNALAVLREMRSVVGEIGLAPAVFTCDNCASAPVCPLVFDWYNTDGDCLMEK